VPCDLAETESVRTACEVILSEEARLDVLINNGAPWLEARIDDCSDAEIVRTVSGAVSGTILITRGLIPGLRKSTCPDIITIVSTSGIPGWDLDGGSILFCAAKHGQSGFSDK